MTAVTEHLTPRNRTTLILLAGVLAACAVTIAVSPGTVPGLTDPAGSPSMHLDMGS